MRIIYFFWTPTSASLSTNTIAPLLLSDSQSTSSMQSPFNQDYRSDYKVIYDRTVMVSANQPCMRIDVSFKLNQVLK